MTLRSVSSQPKDREATRAGLLGQLGAADSALLLSAAADLALVINADGTVGERLYTGPDLAAELFAHWPGKGWAEVSTIESRPKIEQMLQEASMGLPPRWRQINHQRPDGADIPMRYCVLKAGSSGQFVALGRDMRGTAAIQQKLLAAEQSIEQEYARLRHAETRYRLLMQVSSEAILVVDARTGRIAEANSAAANLVNKALEAPHRRAILIHVRRGRCRPRGGGDDRPSRHGPGR